MTTRLFALTVITILVVACSGTPGATPSPGSSPSPTFAEASATATAATPSATPPAPADPVVLPGEPWIAYQDGAGIGLVRPDGTDDHHPIEGISDAQFHPDWSHDGERIAFALDEPDGTRDIWVVRVDGSDPLRVFDCAAPCKWTDSPAWSPDDDELAFEYAYAIADSPDGPGRSMVRVLDLAAGTTRDVFEGEATEYVYSPRWSPDGGAIVLELDRFDSERLDASVVTEMTVGIVDLADPDAAFRPLLPWDSGAAYPDWSLDGARIAMALREAFEAWDGPADLFTIAVDGNDLTQVTTFGADGGRALQPTYTPDGGELIFIAEDTIFEPRVGRIGVDGSGLSQIDDGRDRTHPRLRPT